MVFITEVGTCVTSAGAKKGIAYEQAPFWGYWVKRK